MDRSYSATVRTVVAASVETYALAPGEATDALDGLCQVGIIVENVSGSVSGENWILQYQVSNDGVNWVYLGANSVPVDERQSNEFLVRFRYWRIVADLKEFGGLDLPEGALFNISVCISDM